MALSQYITLGNNTTTAVTKAATDINIKMTIVVPGR